MANSISEVAQNINSYTGADAHQQAAEYAIKACKENGCGYAVEQLKAHLDFLEQVGAEFCETKALAYCMTKIGK